ncbi:MAG: anhydro-N-acetylmuramic acid kinase [Deltaproteobacteria bacterium]|nr:anhydro-N-acetylmuramic acid kinase [Deltaproteobacteria bacterium]
MPPKRPPSRPSLPHPLPPRLGVLSRMAAKPARLVLGLMSGTSLDGLDLALCRVRGAGEHTRLEVVNHATRPYTPAERAHLAQVVFQPTAPLEAVCQLNGWLARLHGRLVLEQLEAWGQDPRGVDLLASHGQTVFHRPGQTPEPPTTLQLGDGDLLAGLTGMLTVSDLRQKDIAAGGEGAPLAPFMDGLLFRHPGRGRLLLNLGGMANFTWLPPGPPGRGGWLSADTGPANTWLDRAVRRYAPHLPGGFDQDGRLALAGRVQPGLLAALKEHPYFERPAPKSTGPEAFGARPLAEALNRVGVAGLAGADRAGDGLAGAGTAEDLPPLAGLSPEDLLATLAQLTVDTASACILREVGEALAGGELYLTGGGAHHPLLAQGLARSLPMLTPASFQDLGVPPDAKEAVLMAVLAHESLFGLGFFPAGQTQPWGFGKLSFPR